MTITTNANTTAAAPKCACGYKRNNDGTCNHDLPGKVTKNRTGEIRSVKDIRCWSWGPQPRPTGRLMTSTKILFFSACALNGLAAGLLLPFVLAVPVAVLVPLALLLI